MYAMRKAFLTLLFFILCLSLRASNKPFNFNEKDLEMWFAKELGRPNTFILSPLSCPYLFNWSLEKTEQYIIELQALTEINKRQSKNWSKATICAKALWNVLNGTLHFILDLAGMVPVIGEVCDLTNGGIYLLQGEGANASLCFAAAIPIVGWAATTGKYISKAVKLSDGSVTFLRWTRKAGIIEFGNAGNLAKVLGTKGTNFEAHHIIPMKIYDNNVVQKAAEAGFHMNDAINGMALEKYTKLIGEGLHANHPSYTTFVEKQIEDYIISIGGKSKLTNESAKNYLEKELIPSLKGYIEKAKLSDKNLNDYFKTLSK